MSNIPKNRQHLLDLIDKHFQKLEEQISELPNEAGSASVDNDFRVIDILVIRIWWVNAVIQWVKDGKRGKEFALPAEGYSWRETPALNRKIAASSRIKKLSTAWKQLDSANIKLLQTIKSLSDRELTKAGAFKWAGKWPVMRWISIGSSTQYDGAAKLIRKATKHIKLL